MHSAFKEEDKFYSMNAEMSEICL